MTDKEKYETLVAELKRLNDETAIGLNEWENGVENGRMEVINALNEKISSMQEEPIYTDFTKALAECISQAQGSVVDLMVHAETWKDELIKLAKSEEPVSEDLEEACDSYYDETWDEHGGRAMVVDDCYDIWFPSHATDDFFKAGAKWQKQQIKKAMDLGEPPYLISIEQAYYRTVKLLED